MHRFARSTIVLALALAGCDPAVVSPDAGADGGTDAGRQYPDSGPVEQVDFPPMGSISEAAGQGGFRFGVASAATQIEDMNADTDWYAWTAPEPDGLGRGTFVGDAVRGYTKSVDDVSLMTELHVDSSRFSIEWARVEPQRDVISEEALTHYGALLDALVAAGIRPMVTIHHFSNPVWVDDPRRVAAGDDCAAGPTDEWLSGWGDAVGGPMIVDEIAEHA